MNTNKSLVILNGFVHDFAAGIWLAAIATIALLHRAHTAHLEITGVINALEHQFFWVSGAAMVLIMATGAGRTSHMWKTGTARMQSGSAAEC